MIQTKHTNHKPGFTMLELIFVIVILGIVASIGSQIIVQVYESYLTQRAVHRSSIKTELAAVQISNRLTYSITGTIIGRKAANDFRAIENIPIGTTDYEILEWISADEDSFGAIGPAWSGYCDVNASSKDSLSTPGSTLSSLNTIISNLSTSGISDTAILFPSSYTARTVGFWNGAAGNTDGIHPVSGNSGTDNLTLDSLGVGVERTIKEHYKLAWSAYAIVPTVKLDAAELANRGFESTDDIYDLELYYDYQPWEGEHYTAGSNTVLIRNISVFKFTGSANTIRFKICQRESIGGNYTINTCKEKAVIR